MLNTTNFKNKEINARLKDKTSIDGIVKEVENNSILIVALNGVWENELKLKFEEIESMILCDFDYFDMRYKTYLRESQKPLFEFRFDSSKLEKLIGAYISLNFDGQIIEGLVKSFKFNNPRKYTITVKNESEEKEIEAYKIREILFIGETQTEYERFIKFNKIRAELIQTYEEDYLVATSLFETTEKDPIEMLEGYIQEIIEKKKGLQVDFSKFKYNWAKEIVDVKAENPEEKLEMLKKANEITKYYEKLKDYIDYIVDYVEDVAFKNSEEEESIEVDFLQYLLESDFLEDL